MLLQQFQGSNLSGQKAKVHPEGVYSTTRGPLSTSLNKPVWFRQDITDIPTDLRPTLVTSGWIQIDPVLFCYKELLVTCPTPNTSPGWFHLIGPQSSTCSTKASDCPTSLLIGWGECRLLATPSLWLASGGEVEEEGFRLMTSSNRFGDSAMRGTTRQQSKSLVRTWLIWQDKLGC